MDVVLWSVVVGEKCGKWLNEAWSVNEWIGMWTVGWWIGV